VLEDKDKRIHKMLGEHKIKAKVKEVWNKDDLFNEGVYQDRQQDISRLVD